MTTVVKWFYSLEHLCSSPSLPFKGCTQCCPFSFLRVGKINLEIEHATQHRDKQKVHEISIFWKSVGNGQIKFPWFMYFSRGTSPKKPSVIIKWAQAATVAEPDVFSRAQILIQANRESQLINGDYWPDNIWFCKFYEYRCTQYSTLN